VAARERREDGRGRANGRVAAGGRLPSKPLQAIDQTQLAQRVYKLLRDKILGREFEPGERLQLALLAQQLGVSRTPVRDALNQLASEGLVEIRPRRGTFVARADLATVEELYQLRLMIDSFIGALVARQITRAQLRQLRQLLEKMERYVVGTSYVDYVAYLERDRAFHSAIVRFAGNRRLAALYEEINLPLWLIRAQDHAGMARSGDAQASLTEHRAILQALESRDPRRVVEAVEAHIHSGRSKLRIGLALESGAAPPVPGSAAPPDPAGSAQRGQPRSAPP